MEKKEETGTDRGIKTGRGRERHGEKRNDKEREVEI